MALGFKNIYIAATSQHVGKTTTTLGLVAGYMNQGYSVGYCKPVGQKFLDIQKLRVDKDCLLFSDLIKFELDPAIHSPVILPSGATKLYLENPNTFNLSEDIVKAKKYLDAHYELMIYEGTGHPGVGSVVEMSNAKVAKLLNAQVIMVVEGGIGSTIDMLNMTTSLFREYNVPILGVIVNKVIPEKVEYIRKYIKLWLDKQNIPLLGIIPYDETLAYPLLSNVKKALSGTTLFFPEMLDNRIEHMLAGSLVNLERLKSNKNILLVASTRTIDRALKKVNNFSMRSDVHDSPLSGIVLTGLEGLDENSIEYIHKHQIPVIQSHFDTYGAVTKINSIEVKINRRTPWKVKKAINIIENNVDFNTILQKVKQ